MVVKIGLDPITGLFIGAQLDAIEWDCSVKLAPVSIWTAIFC